MKPVQQLSSSRAALDAANPEDRERASPVALKALRRVVEAWRLTNAEAAGLLGVSERTWSRIKTGAWSGALSQDQLLRASGIVGLYKGLHLYFNDALANEWVSLPNSGPAFQSRRPLDVMLEEGLIAIYRTRDHVDALRGGL